MKNEYHLTISRTDRIWLIVFVCFLLGWELIKPLLPEQPITEMNLSAIFAETGVTTSIMMDRDSIVDHHASNQNHTDDPTDIQKDTVDIMQATWDELRQLGISAKAASNITKYIAAGGVIKNPQALEKIYGMDSIQLEQALPYLTFPSSTPKTPTIDNKQKWNDRTYAVLDLNTATAVDLETLPGIGTVLAERIVSYRTSLGGFHNVDQLGEVYGLAPETLDKLESRIDILTPIQTIHINQADLAALRHPYLQKKFSRILSAYLLQHGPIANRADLMKVYPPDTTWFHKLLPYISFE